MSPSTLLEESRGFRRPLLSELDARTFTAIRRLVESGEPVWLVVTGVSMHPTLDPGDRVLLTRAGAGPLGGRIVLADVHGHPVLHRVVSQRRGVLVTAGDGCRRADPPVPRSAIIARAEAVYSRSGVSALRPTMRFGARALARYAWLEARAFLWRALRRVRNSRVVSRRTGAAE